MIDRMSTAARLLAAAGVAAVVAGGCQSDPVPVLPRDEQAWSSKGRSALDGEPGVGGERLNAPAPAPVGGRLAAPELRAGAVELLLEATNSTSPQLRANAIEALQAVPERLGPAVRLALGDDNRGVRFVAAMTVGKLRMSEEAHLLEPLRHDPSGSVRAGAIYALRRCGEPVDLSPLGTMVLSDDPELKGNAAFVLGELGDPSAIPLLREAVTRRLTRVSVARARIVELQLAEALVKLGVEEEIEVIRAALFSPGEQGELAALACQMCGRLRDRPYASAIEDKAVRTGPRRDPAEVRLAAAHAVALIEPGRAPIAVPLEYVGSERASLRAQAATTLGAMPHPNTLLTLSALMNDSNPVVQVAAAGAVLNVSRLSAP